MRTCTAALAALINAAYQGAQFEWVMADLYTFTDASGSVLGRFSSSDADIAVNLDGSLTAPPNYVGAINGAPLFQRNNLKFGIGTNNVQLTTAMYADSSKTINGIPWLQALRTGILDGGVVTLYRYLSDQWGRQDVGAINWFSGFVGPLQPIGRSSAKILVNSPLARLDIQMPRELQQGPCANLLYDVKCTLSQNSFKQSGTVVLSGSNRQTINTAGLSQPSPYWTLGKIHFTGGPNTGSWRTIRAQPGTNQISLVVPVWQDCTNGDTFDIFAGCDHTQATCTSKFNNKINFRGAPYTPQPEMIL